MAPAKERARYQRDAALKRLTVTQDLSTKAATDVAVQTLFQVRVTQIESHYQAFRSAHHELVGHLEVAEYAIAEVSNHPANDPYFTSKSVHKKFFPDIEIVEPLSIFAPNSSAFNSHANNIKLPKLNMRISVLPFNNSNYRIACNLLKKR